MNSAEVLRRLCKEKKEWMASIPSQETGWVVRGITICIKHVKDIVKEQKANERIRKPKINRWFARDLSRAITVALGYLGVGNRKRAVRVLEKAQSECRQI